MTRKGLLLFLPILVSALSFLRPSTSSSSSSSSSSSPSSLSFIQLTRSWLSSPNSLISSSSIASFNYQLPSRACGGSSSHHASSSSPTTYQDHRYPDDAIATLQSIIQARRDIRHFIPGPLPEGLINRLIQVAQHAPSVGMMQPWRFIRISSTSNRDALYHLVDKERQATSQSLPTRASEFLALKVEGIREAAEVMVVALMPDREPHIFGRRTMPDMDLASVSCAIQNMWLLARAEGVGLGWVSIFDPEELRAMLEMPVGARAVAILCIGPVASFPPSPLLEMKGWGERLPLEEILFEEKWRDGARGTKVKY